MLAENIALREMSRTDGRVAMSGEGAQVEKGVGM